MQKEIIIAGFGGQGVLFAGQLMTYAAMDQGLHVTWIPSYGPEMRGGTANCTVVISDEEIGSPMVSRPSAVIAMNRPSLDKYEDLVKPGGVLVINQSMVDREVQCNDILVAVVPANKIAENLGENRMVNMVLLGALLANLDILPISAIEKALQEHLPKRHQKLFGLNKMALKEGATYSAAPVSA